MKIGVAIICRYNSSRLPGKILKTINGKPILHHIYDRLSLIFPKENLVVATSDQSTDDPITSFCTKHNIQCFRGSLNNVAKRFLDVANTYQWDYIIRINGDNLLIDLDTISKIVDIGKTNQYDFITNVVGRTFPYGMSVEMVRRSFFQHLFPLFNEEKYQEHVTLFLYENNTYGTQYHFKNAVCPKMKGYKLAIDEPKDFEFAQQLMQALEKNNYQYNLTSLFDIINKTNAK